KRLAEIVRTFPYVGGAKPPAVLIVSPPAPLELGPIAAFPLMAPRTNEWSSFGWAYKQLAGDIGATFFDAGPVAKGDAASDGVHLDAANSRAIGDALAPVVARMLGLTEAKTA